MPSLKPARLLTRSARDYHVAVVGSGPAGFYTSKYLFKKAGPAAEFPSANFMHLNGRKECGLGTKLLGSTRKISVWNLRGLTWVQGG